MTTQDQFTLDPRTIRPHPDIQATHRACNVCQAVLPLDRYHFHRNYRAYSWASSYYTRACIQCLAERRKRWRKENRVAVNRCERGRRARIKASARTARYFQTAEWKALERQKTLDVRASREAMALIRRRMLRLYGPRPDGIKMLIKQRQADALRRRLARDSNPGSGATSQDAKYTRAANDYAAILADLRSKHTAESSSTNY